MQTIRLFRDPGTKTVASLSDLDNPPNLTEEEQKQAAEAEKQKLEAEKARQQQEQKTPEELATARLEELKAKPVEQLTAEEKAELEKLQPPAETEDEDDKEEDGKGDQAGGSFWDDVDKLRGTRLEIDWSKYKDEENNPIDPESPQGALIREQELVKQTLNSWEAQLKKEDPRGYAYLLHRQSGGTDEEFFSQKSLNLPEYETFKASIDHQRALYRQYLMDKGLDDEIVTAQVDKAVKDGKLFEKADAVYKEVQTTQENELKAIDEANKRELKEYEDSANKLAQTIATKVQEGKGLSIVIPEADKQAFRSFVLDKVQYRSEDKKFLLALDLNSEERDRVLEAMYLLYKQGDLSKLIRKEAKKETVHRLKRAVEKSKSTKPAGSSDDGQQSGAKIVTLGML